MAVLMVSHGWGAGHSGQNGLQNGSAAASSLSTRDLDGTGQARLASRGAAASTPPSNGDRAHRGGACGFEVCRSPASP